MTKIDIDTIAITQRRTPSRIKANLHKVIESVSHVVLGIKAAAITTQLCDKGCRLHIHDAHSYLSILQCS